ncbi:MAG: membrane protein insertase YidC [Microbacterium sp.]
MDFFSFPPLAALLDVAYTGLMGLATLLEPVAGSAAAAAAVVLVTLLVRAVLIPTGIAQAKAEQTRARLAPKLRDLQKRWARNPERLQRETMQLYRDERTSPFAGCLPVLAQAPVVGLLYAVFLHTDIAGHANALLGEALLGVPLGTSLAGTLATGTLDVSSGFVFGILVLLIAAVGEVTRRVFRMPHAPDGPSVPSGVLGALQFVTAVVAVFVPLAAGLYLLVTVVWTLVQRIVLRRAYPVASS